MKAADALGYRPNVIARSLITRRTNMVAIVIANLSDPLYPAILEELTRRIQARGRQTLLFIPPDESRMDETLSSLLQYQVDGIVMASATLSSAMARVCAARNTPVVLFNRYVPGLKIRAVSCDNVAGGREVAHFLAGLGHERPVFVSGQSDATTNLDRFSGFSSGWKALGLSTVRHLDGGSYSYEAGHAAALRLAGEADLPDAIVFASDIMAFGGIEALRGAGIRVPEDVSVVGFDDVFLSRWPSIGLTTIRLPLGAMADATLELLGFDGPAKKGAQTTLLPGELIVRSTTRQRGPVRRVRAGTRRSGPGSG